ncbi:MAG: YlxR family protein [Bacilli bacterium]|nr:YlxR family protein [Bacilli bacterium]NLN80122.1 YlxR family protein [Erysipelotrichia bacterium]
MKKIPLRRCTLTNKVLPKQELLRIVKTKDDQVFVDLSGRANGRGAYLQKDLDPSLFLKKKHLLEKALKIKLPEKVLLEVEDILKSGR